VVSAQGLGAMGMTAFYKANDPKTEEECLETFGKALECGVNFIDTAWIYQNFETGETNEALVGKAVKKFGREKFVIATKFGIVPSATGLGADGSPEAIRKQLCDSLERLGVEYIDLYYMHRMDPKTPIEETMKCLLELKREGLIKYVGLSECTPSELERAHAVMPVSAIQMEWSLQSREIEAAVVPTARKLGVGIVAYSPLGRGFLSRTFTKKQDLAPGDWRNTQPRFDAANFDKNAEAAAKVEKIAARKGVTPAQVLVMLVHCASECRASVLRVLCPYLCCFCTRST
jgi:aryl-alcohol dehydrogenase-like predicted oxidoreductase